WQQQGYPCLPLAVNLSAVQFRRRNLVQDIARILDESGLNPCYLELELTESMLMRNAADIIAMLQTFHDMGIRLSVDDFGTGYSNLAYLKRFPIDILKIDRSFVRDLPDDSEDAIIAQTIIAMAHSLNLRVVAEGVETAAQLEWLRRQGCDQYQGFYFSPPLPATEFERLLAQVALSAESYS
ncbi:MAG TPA: EAL domain-containing protein, partial [Candidatus Competibacteraceae bacterium]|nr:EAL domain-containing protein [Candidatus Competibacteraceae bacterium]